jgi:hypothetical protein
MVERELFPLFLPFAGGNSGNNCLDRFRLHCMLLQDKEIGRVSFLLKKHEQKSHPKKRALDSDVAVVVEFWKAGQFPEGCWFGGRRRDSVYTYTILVTVHRAVCYVSGTRRVPAVVAVNMEAPAHGVCRILSMA